MRCFSTALIASGVFGGLAHIAMTEAVACAPVSTLAPFEYTAMIWALLFDVLIFALWPELISLLDVERPKVVDVVSWAAKNGDRRAGRKKSTCTTSRTSNSAKPFPTACTISPATKAG